MSLIQLKTAISRATSRNDVSTIRDALEVSAEMFKKDANNVSDYVQRHLISLSIWEELRYVLSITVYFQPFHATYHLCIFHLLEHMDMWVLLNLKCYVTVSFK